MRKLTVLLFLITIILISLTIGCDRDEEHIETLIIGPYRTECPSFSGSDCYLEFNEEAGKWHFFYEGIQGFDYEEGFIWTLKVRLEDRGTEIQDVGRYAYHLIEVLSKEEASVDERPPRNPLED